MARFRIFLFAFAPFLTTCSSSPKIVDPSLGFEPSDRVGSASKLWTKPMPGLVTDMSISQNGKRALLTIVPDSDALAKGESNNLVKQPVLGMIDDDGEIKWQKSFDGKPKWQALSLKGDLAVATTVEGKLIAIDGSGKTLWERENYCKPQILESISRIICTREDDAKPSGVAFDVYDYAGNKTQMFPTQAELLDLAVSVDSRYAAVAFAGGKVLLLETTGFKTLWESKVASDVISMTVSSGDQPVVAVLHYRKNEIGRHVQTLTLFDRQGAVKDQLTPAGTFDQVAISPSSETLGLYGNSPKGQIVASFSGASGAPHFKEIWRHQTTRYSDFSAPLVVVNERMIAGFEDSGDPDNGKSVAHLFSFDRSGKVEWTIPLVSEEGGYLFSYSREGSQPILFGVSDSGVVSAYRLE